MARRPYFATARWLMAGALAWGSPPARADADANRDPVVDMLFQPLRDVHLMRDPIPPRLLAILAAPYAIDGLRTCAAMAREVSELDAVLPTDVGYDQPRRGMTGRLTDQGRSMIGGIIPFRGVVRELSGANAAELRLVRAIRIGEVRRAFLKGLGLARGCAPPAAPPEPRLAYVLAGF